MLSDYNLINWPSRVDCHLKRRETLTVNVGRSLLNPNFESGSSQDLKNELPEPRLVFVDGNVGVVDDLVGVLVQKSGQNAGGTYKILQKNKILFRLTNWHLAHFNCTVLYCICYKTIRSGQVTHWKDAAKAGVLCFTSVTFCNNNGSCSLRLNERIYICIHSSVFYLIELAVIINLHNIVLYKSYGTIQWSCFYI